jgi:hypothetical protein
MKAASVFLIAACFLAGAGLRWTSQSNPPPAGAKLTQQITAATAGAGGREAPNGSQEGFLLAMLNISQQAKAAGYESAVRSLLAEPDSMGRAIRLEQIAGSWQLEDPLACLKVLAEFGQEQLITGESWLAASLTDPAASWGVMQKSKHPWHLGALLSAALERDPALAEEILASANTHRKRLADLGGAAINPTKLAAWLANKTPSKASLALQAQAIDAWAAKDAGAAADHYLALGKPVESDSLAKLIAARPDGFAAKMADYGGCIRNNAQLVFASRLASHRPAAVAEFINNMAPSPTRITLAWACVGEISDTNPAAAVKFAKTIESGGARLDGLAQAFARWEQTTDENEKQNRQAALDELPPHERAYVEKNKGNMPGVASFL